MAFDNLCKLLSETYLDRFRQPTVLLPFAADPEHLLQRVATQVQRLDERQRRQVFNYTQILAGLKYQKALIQQLFQEGMMRESVIYQEILEEGRQEGSQALLLHLLTRRLGTLPPLLQSQIASLPLPQLEVLEEALLEFQAIADLETWLQANL